MSSRMLRLSLGESGAWEERERRSHVSHVHKYEYEYECGRFGIGGG
jgi:hypothetical protein